MNPKQKTHCSSAARALGGARCSICDPFVQSTTYGLPCDGYRRVVERVVVSGVTQRIERSVVSWPVAPAEPA